jgi:hypothetical protein
MDEPLKDDDAELEPLDDLDDPLLPISKKKVDDDDADLDDTVDIDELADLDDPEEEEEDQW